MVELTTKNSTYTGQNIEFDIAVNSRSMTIQELQLLVQDLKQLDSIYTTNQMVLSYIGACSFIGNQLDSFITIIDTRSSTQDYLDCLKAVIQLFESFIESSLDLSQTKSEIIQTEMTNFADILTTYITQFIIVSTLFVKDILAFDEYHLRSLFKCTRSITATIKELISLSQVD